MSQNQVEPLNPYWIALCKAIEEAKGKSIVIATTRANVHILVCDYKLLKPSDEKEMLYIQGLCSTDFEDLERLAQKIIESINLKIRFDVKNPKPVNWYLSPDSIREFCIVEPDKDIAQNIEKLFR